MTASASLTYTARAAQAHWPAASCINRAARLPPVAAITNGRSQATAATAAKAAKAAKAATAEAAATSERASNALYCVCGAAACNTHARTHTCTQRDKLMHTHTASQAHAHSHSKTGSCTRTQRDRLMHTHTARQAHAHAHSERQADWESATCTQRESDVPRDCERACTESALMQLCLVAVSALPFRRVAVPCLALPLFRRVSDAMLQLTIFSNAINNRALPLPLAGAATQRSRDAAPTATTLCLAREC